VARFSTLTNASIGDAGTLPAHLGPYIFTLGNQFGAAERRGLDNHIVAIMVAQEAIVEIAHAQSAACRSLVAGTDWVVCSSTSSRPFRGVLGHWFGLVEGVKSWILERLVGVAGGELDLGREQSTSLPIGARNERQPCPFSIVW